LGIAAPAPLYVTSIDPTANTITVGSKQETYHSDLSASMVNWITPKPADTLILKAKIRYRHQEAEAEVTPVGDDGAKVHFRVPQMAITAGQAVVFYNDDVVVGGGTIDRVIQEAF
jgi:tRNA-specific 2-thiouridylase